jgi:hypothetical protein
LNILNYLNDKAQTCAEFHDAKLTVLQQIIGCCKFSSDAVVVATGCRGDAGVAPTAPTPADDTGCHCITGKFTAS